MSLWSTLQPRRPKLASQLYDLLLHADYIEQRWGGFNDVDVAAVLEGAPKIASRIASAGFSEPTIAWSILTDRALLRSFSVACPSQLELLLLAGSGDAAVRENNRGKPSYLEDWWQSTQTIQVAMPTAHSVCEGLDAADDWTEFYRGRAAMEPKSTSELTSARARLVAVAVLCMNLNTRRFNSKRDLDFEGVRSTFHRTLDESPEEWGLTLPWLLQILPADCDEIVDGTILALERDRDLSAILEGLASHPITRIATRAKGLRQVLQGDSSDEAFNLHTSVLARAMDLSSVFPKPLGQPSATWMSSRDLEESFINAIKTAEQRFSEEFRAWARAEEEGHVARLMTRIETQLEHQSKYRAVEGGSRRAPVEVTGSYRPIPKSEEKGVGADLALVISIDVDRKLDVEFAEFVQVKKSYKAADIGDRDQWRISVGQIGTVLQASPTASYWLICANGSVIAVPAKLLQAKANALGKAPDGTFTLYYKDVRHAAIDLHGYLTFLLVGAWTGSADVGTVRLARGHGDSTVARAVFELRVSYSPREDIGERR